MRALIYNPTGLPTLAGAAERLQIEQVSGPALEAAAARLARNGQLPLLLAGGGGALVPVVRRLRASGFGGPLLVLAPAEAASIRVELLNAGADDVVTAPVDPVELEARIAAILRREHGILGETVEIGTLVFHLDGRHPQLAGREMRLSAREYDILRHLVLNVERVVSKTSIYDALYALSAEPPFEKIIDVYICRLRAKIALAGLGAPAIITVAGRGYSLRRPAACAEVGAAHGAEAPSV